MRWKLNAEAACFNVAKAHVLLGLTASCWLWLFGFFCVGGEWLVMWQLPLWNGQPLGFQMFVIASVVLLVVLLLVRQSDLESNGK